MPSISTVLGRASICIDESNVDVHKKLALLFRNIAVSILVLLHWVDLERYQT